MKNFFVLIACISLMPFLSFADEYRYSRVTAKYDVQSDGGVDVSLLLTFLFDENYNMIWQLIPKEEHSVIEDVSVFDGTTGLPLERAITTLDWENPESYGKYAVEETETGTKVEWYFETNDRVHTWVFKYRVRGAVEFGDDSDMLTRTIVDNLSVPVDTVEAEVQLPGAMRHPHFNLFSSGDHDYYIDRPDEKSIRYRVSSIKSGERVSIEAGWQKGIVHPNVPLMPLSIPDWMQGKIVRISIGLAALLAVAVAGTWLLRRRFGAMILESVPAVSSTPEAAAGESEPQVQSEPVVEAPPAEIPAETPAAPTT